MRLDGGGSSVCRAAALIMLTRSPTQVVGRLKPSAQYGTRKSDIFKMNVFAPNKIVAKSRFWYYMSMLNRVKKANGEILQINEVCSSLRP